MFRSSNRAPAIAALTASLFFSMAQDACAASDDDLKELREQVRQLKDLYEKKINELEARLKQAEQTAGQAKSSATAAQTTAEQAAVQASSRTAGEGAFNPGISAILNGVYGNLSQNPSNYRINGFAPTMGEVAPPNRGLGLGESEIAFSANIDRHFRGTLIAALSPEDTVSVEEAHIQTLGLSNGFTLKAGRFFSGVGYHNEIHAHAWDFTDAPLANKVFLGNQLAEDGFQVKWIAPTDLYANIGLEFGRGRKFPGGPDGGRMKNGFGSTNLFAHLGGDWGTGAAWRVGLSHLRTRVHDRAFNDVDSTGTGVTNSIGAASRLWVIDGVLKWAPNGNASNTSFKLQGEYFRRTEDGQLTYDTAAASLGTQSGSYLSKQSGWYLQGVYQFQPEWRVGYRYDRLDSGTTGLGLVANGPLTAADFPILASYKPIRNTMMLDWSASEFSRVRLQFARDRARAGIADNQFFLQYIISMGAHGGHKF